VGKPDLATRRLRIVHDPDTVHERRNVIARQEVTGQRTELTLGVAAVGAPIFEWPQPGFAVAGQGYDAFDVGGRP
jgi:hypothetical protein